MPDISMCRNKTCKMRHKCYRYMAKPHGFWQSYAAFKPNIKGECDAFISTDQAPTKCLKVEEINEQI